MPTCNNITKGKRRYKDYAQKEKHQKRSRYKYLEVWINEKENLEKHLEEMERKVPFMINEVKRLEDPHRVGIMTPKIKFKIYEAIIMPILMYAIQTWSKLWIKDVEKFLDFWTSKTTPFWGVVAECGIWPVEDRINERKLMWCYSLI